MGEVNRFDAAGEQLHGAGGGPGQRMQKLQAVAYDCTLNSEFQSPGKPCILISSCALALARKSFNCQQGWVGLWRKLPDLGSVVQRSAAVAAGRRRLETFLNHPCSSLHSLAALKHCLRRCANFTDDLKTE